MRFLLKNILRLLAVAGVLLIIAQVVPGIVIGSVYIACVVAVLWGLVSMIVKPIITILTLPINFFTLGLFSLVINAGLFWFLSTFVQGFSVSGFVPALEGSLLLSIAVWMISKIF